MNRMKYRVCLIVLALLATLFGVWYYTYGKEKQEPYSGGTLVQREVNPESFSCMAIVLKPEKEVFL